MNISKALIVATTALLCFTLVPAQSTRAKEQPASSIEKTKRVKKKQPKDPNIAIIGIGIKAIQRASIDMIRRPVFKTIDASKEHPLVLNINKPANEATDQAERYVEIDKIDDAIVKIYQETSLQARTEVKIGMQLPKDGSAMASGTIVGYIASGEYVITTAFMINDKKLLFDDMKISFIDNNGGYILSEGTVCVLDATKYIYANKVWSKLES